MARLDVLLKAARDLGASDLHVLSGYPPALRLHGEIQPVDFQTITPEQCRQLVYEMMTDEQVSRYENLGSLDFSYEIPGELRVRANVFEQHRGVSACFRLLPSQIFPFEQLGLPPSILRLTELPKGLVVVTGPPGSGKSSTLAALVDHINSTQRKHIISLEDPIEYVHANKLSIVNQREVGRHIRNLPSGLRDALREDPDIILVGEMRDPETIALALTAAEVGQLVFGTLHTASAPQAIHRIVDAFSGNEQDPIRASLAECLQGVVAQRLLRRADGRGRIAAVEMLVVTPAIAGRIRDGRTQQIVSVMQAGRHAGMQLMEDSLVQLVNDGRVTASDAGLLANDPRTHARRPTVHRDGMVA